MIFCRKSLNLHGLRLNLTGRGLGLSAGLKGARIGIGTRGAYVAGGRQGIYFRHYLLAGHGAAKPTVAGCAAAFCAVTGLIVCASWLAFVAWVITR